MGAWCNKCGEEIWGIGPCPNCVSDPPQQPEASSEEDSRAASGSATFSGQHADQYEAMKRALSDAAEWYGEAGEYAEYNYLQKVPRTSLVVELVDALHRSGFQITKSPNVADERPALARKD